MIIQKVIYNLQMFGIVETARKIVRKLGRPYEKTMHLSYYMPSEEEKKRQSSLMNEQGTVFSIAVPLYNTPESFLKQMIDSVQKQTYSRWELCLADGSDDDHKYVGDICKGYAANDRRIRYVKLDHNRGISENTNEALLMSSGDYIGLLDHDDMLHDSALFWVESAIRNTRADFLYTDELVFRSDTDLLEAVHHKADYGIDNLRANNYICHFSVFKKELLESTGYFRSEYDGSQDHDLILRLTENAKRVEHIPEVLYFWRQHIGSVASNISVKPYAIEAGRKAVYAQLQRMGIEGEVTSVDFCPTIYRIRYELKQALKTALVIVYSGNLQNLNDCIWSIINQTDNSCYCIYLVASETDRDSISNFIQDRSNTSCKISAVFASEGNKADLLNDILRHLEEPLAVLMSDNVTVSGKDWLNELVMYGQRKDVAIVGCKVLNDKNKIISAGITLDVDHLSGNIYYGYPKTAQGFMGRNFYQQEIGAVSFACFLVNRDAFLKLNGFNPLYHFDQSWVTDFCIKCHKFKYNVVWTPYCEVILHEDYVKKMHKIRRSSEALEDQRRLSIEKKNCGLLVDTFYNKHFSRDFADYRIVKKKG